MIRRFPDVNFSYVILQYLFRHGVDSFVKKCAGIGIRGSSCRLTMEEDEPPTMSC
jgi:hypothetical protein